GVPVVVNTVHGLYATPDDRLVKRAVVYAAEAFASRWSDAEMIQSAEDVELIQRLHLAPRRRVRHLGNGIDLTRFHPAAQRRHPAPVVVGTVGRLVAEKGYVELFEAMRLVGDRARLVVVGGDDPDKPDALDPHVIAAARAVGVEFLGHRHDVDQLYPDFDLFVLASHREGMPRALMEAAASGLPAVATDIRGCREVVDNGVTGLLVKPRSAAALAAAITTLVDSADLRRRMGDAARARAEELFDERRIVRQVIATYRNVAAKKSITLVADPNATATPAG
ncbi:MAG TPA: glycosyltransferase, partial [Ilumatobacteraceae bacterium]|nr:glycosyltransferase [Ilumatobacteraceae bacterium]